MKPASAEFGRHAPALVAAAAAVAATWFARTRVAPPDVPVLADLAVHEDISTSAHDLPPYLTGDLDGDGVPEIVLRVRSAAGPEAIVLARDGAHYDLVGRVPLSVAPRACPATVTLEDGALLVTSHGAGCAPVERAYYRVHAGHLVRVGLVDDAR